MNKLYLLAILLCSFACSTQLQQDEELLQLTEWMTGEFSSKAQAERDSAFFSINLVMHPIWENNQGAKWLYVEQAVSSAHDRPYRQRVYRISRTDEGTIESRVYELPGPERFIHAWDDPALFQNITPDSLVIREGCAVFLKKSEGECFTGSTPGKECLSTLRGAAYATSKVDVCPDRIESWDQGWDADDQQVWGAVKGGYIFEKIR